MAIWRKGRTTWTELERVFWYWIYFHLSSEIFYGPFTGGDRPPWIRHWLGFQSEQVVYMLTSGCQVDFACWTLCGSLWKASFHARTCVYMLPINEQKRSAMSFSFGYFSETIGLLAGRMRPAGRQLDNTVLGLRLFTISSNIHYVNT